jgi:hypothetical protein
MDLPYGYRFHEMRQKSRIRNGSALPIGVTRKLPLGGPQALCMERAQIADPVVTVRQVPKVYRALARTTRERQVPAAAVTPPPNLTDCPPGLLRAFVECAAPLKDYERQNPSIAFMRRFCSVVT